MIHMLFVPLVAGSAAAPEQVKNHVSVPNLLLRYRYECFGMRVDNDPHVVRALRCRLRRCTSYSARLSA
jgi:hypothetical protein